ncbi:MFS transporter [Parathalassolituus penaei]|uniref:MFS transporter n=1 Tax=Parathalassolituus penaei TaxID=2997323 RepID=A0A9X3EET5_9GAMM|nr:MFS transporter [Parathalassolituus penaei]MCY0966288.1 MFS transporter [Parathalassolituus penaei]
MNKNATPIARPFHAWLLLLCGCMSVLAAVVIAPVLPQMQEHFSATDNVEFLVPMALTAPGLVIALLSMVVGVLADRTGRKNLLVVGLAMYAVFGVAPVFIDSLPTIIGTRIGVGLAEAIIMTASVALIGDYYSGVQRERYLALNTTLSSMSAVIFIAVGGALGEFGWRTPFMVYSISLILAVLALLVLWEPRSHKEEHLLDKLTAEEEAMWNPWKIAGICAVTLVGGVLFMAVQVHIGYLLHSVNVTAPSSIGLLASLAQVAVVVGSLCFRLFLNKAWYVTPVRLSLAFGLIGTGFMLVGSAHGEVTIMVAGTLVTGLGGGMLLPSMMVWNMSNLPPHRRALGTGAWMAAFFLGQFFTPIVVVGLQEVLGSHAAAIGFIGQFVLPAAILVAIGQRLQRNKTLSVA